MSDEQMYIDGLWTASESGDYFDSYNPATLKTIAHVPQGTRGDAQRALIAADRAASQMAAMPVWDRARLLHRIADVVEARKEQLARTLSEDQGVTIWKRFRK